MITFLGTCDYKITILLGQLRIFLESEVTKTLFCKVTLICWLQNSVSITTLVVPSNHHRGFESERVFVTSRGVKISSHTSGVTYCILRNLVFSEFAKDGKSPNY